MDPTLFGLRGKFRTPYRLLAAVHGFGFDDRPAQSFSEVLRRLGFTVNPVSGIDKGNYHRAAAAAEFFEITVPPLEKDGTRSARRSGLADVAEFAAAWELAKPNQEPVALCSGRSSAPAAPLGHREVLTITRLEWEWSSTTVCR